MSLEVAVETNECQDSSGVDELEARVQSSLAGRVWGLRLMLQGNGLVLMGRTRTYYAKQLAQHAVMKTSRIPIAANAIEVA